MKRDPLTAILFMLLSSLFGSAQPGSLPLGDFDKPCNYLENKEYDLNNDGEIDIVLYVGSEGTDDVPSSSGVCFYNFSIANGGYIKSKDEARYNYLFTEGRQYERANLDFLPPSQVYLPKLLLTPYPTREEQSWQTHLERDIVFLPIYLVERRDTSIGWVKIVVNTEQGEIHLEDASLTFGSDFKVGSDEPARSDYFLLLESGPKVGLGLYNVGNSIEPSDIGINATYSFRYGLRKSWISYAHIQGDLGFELYNFENELFFAPKATALLHLLFLDIGISGMYYTSESGYFVPRFEMGLSLNQFQFNVGINLREPDINIPVGMIQLNYFFPLSYRRQ